MMTTMTPDAVYGRSTLAVILRSLRRRRGFTQVQLAARLALRDPAHNWDELLADVEAGHRILARQQLDVVGDELAVRTSLLVKFTAAAISRLMGEVRNSLSRRSVEDRAQLCAQVSVDPRHVEAWLADPTNQAKCPPVGVTQRLAAAVALPQPWYLPPRDPRTPPGRPSVATLPDLIAEGIASAGLAVADMAAVLNVPESRIADWVDGQAVPPITSLPVLADVLDAPLNDLLAAHVETGTSPTEDGSRLRDARRAAGLDLRDVSTVLRVPLPTVQMWESGELAPRPEVADVLDSLYYVGEVGMADPPENRPDLSRFSRILRHYRHAEGKNYQAAANALGVCRKTVTRWETDERTPAISQLRSLAALYHAPLGPLVVAHPHSFSNPDREVEID